MRATIPEVDLHIRMRRREPVQLVGATADEILAKVRIVEASIKKLVDNNTK